VPLERREDPLIAHVPLREPAGEASMIVLRAVAEVRIHLELERVVQQGDEAQLAPERVRVGDVPEHPGDMFADRALGVAGPRVAPRPAVLENGIRGEPELERRFRLESVHDHAGSLVERAGHSHGARHRPWAGTARRPSGFPDCRSGLGASASRDACPSPDRR
jgi:hypothetical protein